MHWIAPGRLKADTEYTVCVCEAALGGAQGRHGGVENRWRGVIYIQRSTYLGRKAGMGGGGRESVKWTPPVVATFFAVSHTWDGSGGTGGRRATSRKGSVGLHGG